MNIWLRSNILFFRAYLLLNSLKVVSTLIGVSFFSYFWVIKSENGLSGLLMNVENLSIMLSIFFVTCVSYAIIQRQTICIRLREVFVWKWFGMTPIKLFWLFFIEHLLIVGFSGFLTLAVFDVFYNLMTGSHIRMDFTSVDLLLPILVAVILLTIMGLWQIFFVSRIDKKQVFNKISSQIRDNL